MFPLCRCECSQYFDGKNCDHEIGYLKRVKLMLDLNENDCIDGTNIQIQIKFDDGDTCILDPINDLNKKNIHIWSAKQKTLGNCKNVKFPIHETFQVILKTGNEGKICPISALFAVQKSNGRFARFCNTFDSNVSESYEVRLGDCEEHWPDRQRS